MSGFEERKKVLDAKLKEMAEDGIKKGFSTFYDEDDDVQEEVVQPSVKIKEQSNVSTLQETSQTHTASDKRLKQSLSDYRATFLHPIRIREKTNFTINKETLKILRYILQDLDEEVSMVAYIENILQEHIHSYRELLNTATAKQRRKTTIPL